MSLFRSAAVISALTFLSRISGLARDVIVAKTFGASPLTDAFWVAFRIPNLLRRLFAEGAFSQAFVPILGEVKNKHGEEETRTLIDHVTVVLFFAVTVITLLGIVVSPWLVSFMASGISKNGNSAYDAAVWMTQVMFPYIICMALTALASGVLNTWGKFSIPAFSPILLNIAMIVACSSLTSLFASPIYALSIGVMVGGVAQLLYLWFALAKIGLLPRFKLNLKTAWKDDKVRRIIRQMGPATLGVSVAQISILINTNIATWLTAGSVTWLSFSDRLMEFPTALLGVALGTVLLPHLSSAHAKNDLQQYSALLDWGLRLTVLLGIPCTIGLAMLSEGLVASLFNYGQFNAFDVHQTRNSVMAYSLGLLGILSVKILAPGFYAKQDIRTPVKIAISILICTQLMNLAFVPLFAHAGLTLSIGLGSSLNALFLLISLRKRKIYVPQAGWLGFFLRLSPAIIILVAWLFLANQHISWTEFNAQSWNGMINNQLQSLIGLGTHSSFVVSRLIILFLVLIVSVVAYFLVLRLAGFKVKELLRKSLN